MIKNVIRKEYDKQYDKQYPLHEISTQEIN